MLSNLSLNIKFRVKPHQSQGMQLSKRGVEDVAVVVNLESFLP